MTKSKAYLWFEAGQGHASVLSLSVNLGRCPSVFSDLVPRVSN